MADDMGPENKHGGHVNKDYGRRQGVCTHDMYIYLDNLNSDSLQSLYRARVRTTTQNLLVTLFVVAGFR